MSEYAEVDGVIENWADKVGSTLFRGLGGHAARFFYVPGKIASECFMVSVMPPRQGRLHVRAGSVDTSDGAEMLEAWEGPEGEIDALLRKATATVQRWKERPQAYA